MSHSYYANHEFASIKAASQKSIVVNLTGATTLTTGQSGTHFFVSSTAATAVTLPAATAGVNFQITVGATAASHSIVAPSAILHGTIIGAASTGGGLMSPAASTSLTTTAGSAIGDTVSLTSNGAKWFVNGTARSFNAFVVA